MAFSESSSSAEDAFFALSPDEDDELEEPHKLLAALRGSELLRRQQGRDPPCLRVESP